MGTGVKRWTYRVMRTTDSQGTTGYGLHQMFYDENDDAHWSEMPSGPRSTAGDDPTPLTALTLELLHMKRALDQPVLDVKTGRVVEEPLSARFEDPLYTSLRAN